MTGNKQIVLAVLAGVLLGAGSLLLLFKFQPRVAGVWLSKESKVQPGAPDPGTSLWFAVPSGEKAAPDRGATPAPKESEAGTAGEEEDALLASPLAQMRRMAEDMDKQMAGAMMGGGGGSPQIESKEDEHYVSFEIRGVDATKLSTSVENGYLTIAGESRKQKGHASYSSSFRRMFALPPSVDAARMETTSEKDKVILRFPKRRGR